jgi:hypothetical protein
MMLFTNRGNTKKKTAKQGLTVTGLTKAWGSCQPKLRTTSPSLPSEAQSHTTLVTTHQRQRPPALRAQSRSPTWPRRRWSRRAAPEEVRHRIVLS